MQKITLTSFLLATTMLAIQTNCAYAYDTIYEQMVGIDAGTATPDSGTTNQYTYELKSNTTETIEHPSGPSDFVSLKNSIDWVIDGTNAENEIVKGTVSIQPTEADGATLTIKNVGGFNSNVNEEESIGESRK